MLLGEFLRKNIEVMNKLSETLERHEKLLDKIALRLDSIALELNDIKSRAKKIDVIGPRLRIVKKDINGIAMELGALTESTYFIQE